MFSYLPDALRKHEPRFPVRKTLADPTDGSGSATKLPSAEARGWLDVWKQFLLACEQTGRYDDVASQLLTPHLQQVLTPAKLQAFMESVFDAVGHVHCIESFAPAGTAAISGAAIGGTVLAAPSGPRNVYRSAVVFSKNGFGATRLTFECIFGTHDSRLHGLARVSRPEPVPYRSAADAQLQLDLLTSEWRQFLALCEGHEYDRAVKQHFTEALGKVLPPAQLREFFGSFFRELGGVRYATPFVRVGADGLPLPPVTDPASPAGPTASAIGTATPGRPSMPNASSLTLPALTPHTPTPDALDVKHAGGSHSRVPSKSYNADPSQAQAGLLSPTQRPATGSSSGSGGGNSTPGTVAISAYQSTVTFARGVVASWTVTFEVGFYFDRITSVRSLTGADAQPIPDAARADLLVAYHRVFSRFMELCSAERDDFATACSTCLSPPLQTHLPPAKLRDFMSFVRVCGRVTRVGPVQPHPVHPTANQRNSFVCTVHLAKADDRYGKWTATFELAFWRDRISLLGCPAGVQPVVLTPSERQLQQQAWHEVWERFIRACESKAYDNAVNAHFTPAFAANLPPTELAAFMNPFWQYGSITAVSALKPRAAAADTDAKANPPPTAPVGSSGSSGSEAAGAGAAGAASVSQSFVSTVTIARDAFAKFEVEFVLYFWVDRINGLVCPKGLVETALAGAEQQTQLNALFNVWSGVLDLCEKGRYRDALSAHFTDALREHMPEEKLHDWFGGFFRLYGSVKAVGAVEPVLSSAAAAQAAANGGGQHQQLYTSLVIFQTGVFAKWFVTFDLAFWRDKLNALYCQKPPEMCHLTNDEREKQLRALHELWTAFLSLCEQKRWADACANHFSANLRAAVTPQRLEAFYTAISNRCGALQLPVGQLNPSPAAEGDGSNGQAYTSRAVFATPDFVSKSEVTFDCAFWGDKLNGFNSTAPPAPAALDAHERALQSAALLRVWRAVLELAAAGEYAEAVSRHFVSAASPGVSPGTGPGGAAAGVGVDPHRLHALLAPVFERAGAVRSVGKLTRVKAIRKAGSSDGGSGGDSGAASPKAGGGGSGDDDGDGDDSDSGDGDAPVLFRSTVVLGRSAFHRWRVVFEAHFWRDKLCSLSAPGGVEFLPPLTPAPNSDGVCAATRKYAMRFAPNTGVTRSSVSARGAAGTHVLLKDAAALAAPRRVRVVQSVSVAPGHDFIIAQPLPCAHPSVRDLSVQFIAGGSGTALSPGLAGRRNSLTLRVAGTRMPVELVTPDPNATASASSASAPPLSIDKREVSYMRVTHPASAPTRLELSVCLEFVYTPRALEDGNEVAPPPLIQASPSVGAGESLPGMGAAKIISPFMPAFAPSPKSPAKHPQHAFNFSVDSSAGDTVAMGHLSHPSVDADTSPRAAAAAGAGADGRQHFTTPADTLNQRRPGVGMAMGSPLTMAGMGPGALHRLLPRESADLGAAATVGAAVPALQLSAAETARYIAPTREYSFNTPDAQHYLATHGLLRGKAGAAAAGHAGRSGAGAGASAGAGSGSGSESTVEFAFRVWVWLATNWTLRDDDSKLRALGFGPGVKAAGTVHTSTDSGGYALLFVSVMRANGIPARRVHGLWCDPTDGAADAKHSTHSGASASAGGGGAGKAVARAEFYSDEVRNWVPVQPAAGGGSRAGASATAVASAATAPFGLDPMPFALLPMHFDTPFTPPAAAAGAGAGASAGPSAALSPHWVADWSRDATLNDGGRVTSAHGKLPVASGAGAGASASSGVGPAGLWVVPVKLGLFASDLIVREWKVIVT